MIRWYSLSHRQTKKPEGTYPSGRHPHHLAIHPNTLRCTVPNLHHVSSSALRLSGHHPCHIASHSSTLRCTVPNHPHHVSSSALHLSDHSPCHFTSPVVMFFLLV